MHYKLTKLIQDLDLILKAAKTYMNQYLLREKLKIYN